ncbi:MAG: hypothetical protein R3B72_05735 [Polyangiaceae bacterium]
MAKPIPDAALVRAVTSAPVLGAIGIMALNDHVLKRAGVLPGVVTGKLSDFAFLFFAPIVLAYVARATSWRRRLLCFAIPGALLAAINLSQAASDALSAAMRPFFGMALWPDPTDLVALVSLPLAWWHLASQPHTPRPESFRHSLVTALATLSCLATSAVPPEHPVRPFTHEPVYMSWEELRTSAVAVEAPRPIGKRGKLLVVDGYLLINEPHVGVHIIDDRDPETPVPLLFLRIPGNVDIAVEGDVLYADSYVDLLSFRLDLEAKQVTLIDRVEDQFEYDEHPDIARWERGDYYPTPADHTKGVVIDHRPIREVQP